MALDLTFVIPCHNILSFAWQMKAVITNASKEGVPVVLIENNSSDDTFEFLNNHCHSQNVTLVSTSQHGAPSARNIGLQHVSTNFVKFLDADDVPINHMVKEHLEFLNQSNADFSTSLHFIHGLNQKRLDINFRLPFTDEVPNGILTRTIGVTSGAIFKTHCLRDIHGFDEDLSSNQERDLYWRLHRNGHEHRAFNCFTFVKNETVTGISNATPTMEKEMNQRTLDRQIQRFMGNR